MDGLSELGNKSLGFQPQIALSLFFSSWVLWSVIAIVLYRLFRGRPQGVTSGFQAIEPGKKKRG
jgi:hypothetical protein